MINCKKQKNKRSGKKKWHQMLTNAVSNHYHNADGIEEKKNSTGQIIIGSYCNIFQNECSKITKAKLFFVKLTCIIEYLESRNHITITN